VGNVFWHIMEDADGGYVMAGDTHLDKAPATGEDIHGGLIVKTNADGEVLWQYVVSGEKNEQAHFNSAVVLPGGGYIFVGAVTRSGEKDEDMLWLKLTPSGTTAPPTATPIAESTFDGARVTFVDNAGFLIMVGDKKILIDALFDYYPEGVLKPVVCAQPPPDGVDVILATHEHLDRFAPDLVLKYMQNSPNSIFVPTPSAIDRVLAVDGSIQDRVIPIQLERGESEQVVVNDIVLQALQISHGEPGILNLGFVVAVGRQRTNTHHRC
jgi:hypothetical protein